MIKMEDKYKIIISYIQDLSVEIASPEALVAIRNTIPDYKMTVGLKSKPLKRKMIEVLTTLSYENPNKKIDKGIFQIKYATVIDLLDPQINKNELESYQVNSTINLDQIKPSNKIHNTLYLKDIKTKLSFEDDLLNFEGLNPQMLEVLVKDGIKSLKDFATCADWELAGGYTTIDGKRVRDEGLLEHFELSLSEAQQLIMKAREMLGWVTKEESEEIIKSLVK